jgi:AP-3 complex subunit beta
VNPLKLAEYLNSKYNEDLIEAMKILFAMLLQNKNLDVYLARIINLLPREDLELKRICYAILLEVAAERAN